MSWFQVNVETSCSVRVGKMIKFDFLTLLNLISLQVRDLLRDSGRSSGTVKMGFSGKSIELSQEKIENPTDFARIHKIGMQNRGKDASKIKSTSPAHLYLPFSICFFYIYVILVTFA